jgi:hypothetical protein
MHAYACELDRQAPGRHVVQLLQSALSPRQHELDLVLYIWYSYMRATARLQFIHANVRLAFELMGSAIM